MSAAHRGLSNQVSEGVRALSLSRARLRRASAHLLLSHPMSTEVTTRAALERF